MRLEPAGPASQSSFDDLELPPGSYLVTLSGDGLATVHYPVVLGRGESVRVSVTLPRAMEIPEGFVYVPPGRFLFGTSVEETYRSILGAPPLHEAWTDGYLIGKREVTVAEFVEYLGSLPAAQRVLTSAHSSSQMLTVLREVSPGVWQYRFDFAAARGYTARPGETFRYGLRRSNAVQDWTRFPIIGLSANDAEAYVAWLSRTRLPGARLCTEKEWERAARGADDREYPQGARLYPEDANFADTYEDKIDIGPDEVGQHPTSRSPFGLDDMVGNAWEYTRSSLSGDRYVVRGGSFSYNATQNRLTVRSGITPSYRGPAHGLRVCAPSPVR
jgi:formylglycine-generating enzyme required for sulfatase activity